MIPRLTLSSLTLAVTQNLVAAWVPIKISNDTCYTDVVVLVKRSK